MKDLKLSFPYPSTSRHNLSQDVATSLSMGLVIPVRTIEVLGGDSHRIGTSFSLISNPLVKPLLQGVKMRYCRFWVPRRIYHLDQRANNSNFDLMQAPVRHGYFTELCHPILRNESVGVRQISNFSVSSLFDYLNYASIDSNFVYYSNASDLPETLTRLGSSTEPIRLTAFNAEPYVAYLDIIRNYFADSASGFIGWSWASTDSDDLQTTPFVSSLTDLDAYIDRVQNTKGVIRPFDITRHYSSDSANLFEPFELPSTGGFLARTPISYSASSSESNFVAYTRMSRQGLAMPLLRPDRMSRWYDTTPLTSQNATVAPSEISISNLSFLAKIQKYLTRRFFGGSRFTDVMYSVLGQKVPHVDSPILLDVFDTEIGSELVASTNATADANPGILGGFMSVAGRLTTSQGRYRRRYSFNEPGYLMDVVYVLPRLFRTSFVPDYYFISNGATDTRNVPMNQGNFIPDFNGIGWQQPVQVGGYVTVAKSTSGSFSLGSVNGFACEPSWQQYRTLPDVCSGMLNPLRSSGNPGYFINDNTSLNGPLFVFTDRMHSYNASFGFTNPDSTINSTNLRRLLLSRMCFPDFNQLNMVFGVDDLTYDNIFVVFRYAHQAKRQVSKRFTLNFN